MTINDSMKLRNRLRLDVQAISLAMLWSALFAVGTFWRHYIPSGSDSLDHSFETHMTRWLVQVGVLLIYLTIRTFFDGIYQLTPQVFRLGRYAVSMIRSPR